MKTARFLNRGLRPTAPRRGFTLIEMLTVIAIIIILAGILIPVIMSAMVRARVAATKSELKGISAALEMYLTEFGFYPPDTLAANDNGNANVDLPSEALWFYLCHNFVYKSTELNFNTRDAGATADFTKATVFATKSTGPFYSAEKNYLKDYDGDGVPELCDTWGQWICYNVGGGINGNPLHNTETFDLFSLGPNGKTRQADASSPDYVFQSAVIEGNATKRANWATFVYGSASNVSGGNDTAGDGSNPTTTTYGEKDQDDINNWNTK